VVQRRTDDGWTVTCSVGPLPQHIRGAEPRAAAKGQIAELRTRSTELAIEYASGDNTAGLAAILTSGACHSSRWSRRGAPTGHVSKELPREIEREQARAARRRPARRPLRTRSADLKAQSRTLSRRNGVNGRAARQLPHPRHCRPTPSMWRTRSGVATTTARTIFRETLRLAIATPKMKSRGALGLERTPEKVRVRADRMLSGVSGRRSRVAASLCRACCRRPRLGQPGACKADELIAARDAYQRAVDARKRTNGHQVQRRD